MEQSEIYVYNRLSFHVRWSEEEPRGGGSTKEALLGPQTAFEFVDAHAEPVPPPAPDTKLQVKLSLTFLATAQITVS
jgi:hypothetical protein